MKKHKSHALATSDEEEAVVQAQIAADPEDGDATDADLAQARPFPSAFPALAERITRSRGRPPVDDPKRQISLRLSPSVIDKFKATGKGWQSRINDVLEKAKVG